MSDREAFLAAIAAAPEDDAPRLVYADWLEENGDPERAEFIRAQCQIEPFERRDTDLDRYRRAVIRNDPAQPLPNDFPREMRRYAELVRREQELLKAHRYSWYGPMNQVDEDFESHLSVDFRRGFADEVGIAASLFHWAGEVIREACPMLRRLVLYAPRDQLPDLAAMHTLRGIPELEMAGWITPYDARFLAMFLASNPVTSLTLWIGSEGDDEMIRTLAMRPWADDAEQPSDRAAVLAVEPYLGRLREVVLVQLSRTRYPSAIRSGARSNSEEADSLAAEFNRTIGRPLARVERPFERRFPLREHIGYGLWAGHVDDSPAILNLRDDGVLALFDREGRWRDAIDLQLSKVVPVATGHSRSNRELLALQSTCREHRFVPGTAFVQEFSLEDDYCDLSVQLWGTFENVVADPDMPMEDAEHVEACATLHSYWMKDRNFVIRFGSDYWAGPDGTIHTS